MPGRDVVDDDLARWYALQRVGIANGMTHAEASDEADREMGWINEAKAIHDATLSPRAVVALSEDRQWAVLPGPGTTVALGWAILHHRSEPLPMTQRETTQRWVVEDYAEDTGQDAADVLSAWLEGRQG